MRTTRKGWRWTTVQVLTTVDVSGVIPSTDRRRAIGALTPSLKMPAAEPSEEQAG